MLLESQSPFRVILPMFIFQIPVEQLKTILKERGMLDDSLSIISREIVNLLQHHDVMSKGMRVLKCERAVPLHLEALPCAPACCSSSYTIGANVP